MSDLTPAEKAVAEVLARCLIAPVSPGVVNAAVAAARPHIAAEELRKAAKEIPGKPGVVTFGPEHWRTALLNHADEIDQGGASGG